MSIYYFTFVPLAFWLAFFSISAYGTFRLFRYGPYSTNLIWFSICKWTNPLSCVALGLAISLSIVAGNKLSNIYFMPFFLIGVAIGRIILILILGLIVSPHVKRENEIRRYHREMQEAEERLTREGLYPRRPGLFERAEEWDKFRKAHDELRLQGKFPPAPKFLKKEGANY